ncbi:hypothetical protein [Nocardia arizonensis]|uniref:hypothetical protein n=1 Tax=Nocardia arizonensis TaxID=1141647 RepID=UPI0006CF9979|nr:hypothetical protein [Nocardia arizonensis]
MPTHQVDPAPPRFVDPEFERRYREEMTAAAEEFGAGALVQVEVARGFVADSDVAQRVADVLGAAFDGQLETRIE